VTAVSRHRQLLVNEEKDAVKEDLAVAEAKLASTDTELAKGSRGGVSRSSRATAVATTSDRSEHSGRTDQNIPHRGA